MLSHGWMSDVWGGKPAIIPRNKRTSAECEAFSLAYGINEHNVHFKSLWHLPPCGLSQSFLLIHSVCYTAQRNTGVKQTVKEWGAAAPGTGRDVTQKHSPPPLGKVPTSCFHTDYFRYWWFYDERVTCHRPAFMCELSGCGENNKRQLFTDEMWKKRNFSNLPLMAICTRRVQAHSLLADFLP